MGLVLKCNYNHNRNLRTEGNISKPDGQFWLSQHRRIYCVQGLCKTLKKKETK